MVEGARGGVVGWAVGGSSPSACSDWDWGADGLLLHVIAVARAGHDGHGVPFDLVARPGSLATGERAGLVVAPRPRARLRRRSRRAPSLPRAARACYARRASAQPSAGADRRRPAWASGCAESWRRPAASTSSSGQIAATRVDLVPPDVADELAKLQNQVPPERREAIEVVLEAELGRPVDEVFAEFEWEPLRRHSSEI